MKLNQSLLLLALAGVTMTSCVVPVDRGDRYHSTVGVGYGYYDSLPPTYVGDAYFYGGRYYYGGRYETGRYVDHGRQYNNRYYHNGHYYYGGNHEHHGGSGLSHDRVRQSDHNNDRRDRDRH